MIFRRRGENKIFYCKCCQTKVRKEYNFCPECGHMFDGTAQELTAPEVISRTYKVCGECRWLDDIKTCIGYICKNPNKRWRTETAPYHYRTTKACKSFEELHEKDGMSIEEAIEFIEYNAIRAIPYAGYKALVVMYLLYDE